MTDSARTAKRVAENSIFLECDLQLEVSCGIAKWEWMNERRVSAAVEMSLYKKGEWCTAVNMFGKHVRPVNIKLVNCHATVHNNRSKSLGRSCFENADKRWNSDHAGDRLRCLVLRMHT